MVLARLEQRRLIEEAAARAGSDDFGEPTWQEGLDRLVEALSDEARLSDMGVEIAAENVISQLANRAAILAWRKDHPEIAGRPISRPIVIVGQPRTGTTILHDLLALDPALRAPQTWEVAAPVPPPRPETYTTDPRIAQVQAGLDMTDALIPGFQAFHPMGAQLCPGVRQHHLRGFPQHDFSLQFAIPSYNQWLIYETDMRPSYRYHTISCSICSRSCRDSGCSSRRRTFGTWTRWPRNIPTR